MPRLFVALRPPADVCDRLIDLMAGVPNARWQDDEQLHLTVRFIGEVDGRAAEDVALACSRVRAVAPIVRLAGVGAFEHRGVADTLWADVAPVAPLVALHAAVDRALLIAGVAPDRRAYRPHITVARLARSDGRHPAIAAWLAAHAMLASAPFALDDLLLVESCLTKGGARYDTVAAWPLSAR